ncbi:MAG: hypothetical protein JXR63_09245 [Spirochaetales bacterium]|nr:hypothetical protein [Spirochaetales bacterium]
MKKSLILKILILCCLVACSRSFDVKGLRVMVNDGNQLILTWDNPTHESCPVYIRQSFSEYESFSNFNDDSFSYWKKVYPSLVEDFSYLAYHDIEPGRILQYKIGRRGEIFSIKIPFKSDRVNSINILTSCVSAGAKRCNQSSLFNFFLQDINKFSCGKKCSPSKMFYSTKGRIFCECHDNSSAVIETSNYLILDEFVFSFVDKFEQLSDSVSRFALADSVQVLVTTRQIAEALQQSQNHEILKFFSLVIFSDAKEFYTRKIGKTNILNIGNHNANLEFNRYLAFLKIKDGGEEIFFLSAPDGFDCQAIRGNCKELDLSNPVVREYLKNLEHSLIFLFLKPDMAYNLLAKLGADSYFSSRFHDLEKYKEREFLPYIKFLEVMRKYKSFVDVDLFYEEISEALPLVANSNSGEAMVYWAFALLVREQSISLGIELVESYVSLIRNDLSISNFYFTIGNALFEVQNYKKAVIYYSLASEKNPSSLIVKKSLEQAKIQKYRNFHFSLFWIIGFLYGLPFLYKIRGEYFTKRRLRIYSYLSVVFFIFSWFVGLALFDLDHKILQVIFFPFLFSILVVYVVSTTKFYYDISLNKIFSGKFLSLSFGVFVFVCLVYCLFFLFDRDLLVYLGM